MAYCVQADVEIAVGGADKLRQLTDQAGAGTVDVNVLAAAIAEADAELNSYIGHRYAVPLSPVPDIVKLKSAAWAARVLRRNLYQGVALTDLADAEKLDREWLKGVATGVISLGIEPTPEKSSITIDKAAPRDPTLKVSAARLRGYA